jgi:3-hydroxybutyryl-CoA dehydrogenase
MSEIAGVDIKNCAVIGCGVMGFGIAVVLLNKGFNVTVVEKDESSLERGITHIKKFYEAGIKRGKIKEDEVNENLKRLKGTINLAEIPPDSLTIEVVNEELKLKQEVLRKVEDIIDDDKPIFTNTSSIPVIEIAASLRKPERLIGFHFFNPPPVMKLIEVIPSKKTDERYINFATEFARFLGKEPVITKDTPAFIGNALLVPFILESIRMYESGLASHEDIDKACKLGLGYPMGPFELADFMGLDIVLAIADNVYERTKDKRFAAPATLRELVNAGNLGRKTGKGFYDYKKPKIFGVEM